MPQATPKLRKQWGISDEKASGFLLDAGYKLTKHWTWIPPKNHTSTEEEMSAIAFLIQEWDWGGLE